MLDDLDGDHAAEARVGLCVEEAERVYAVLGEGGEIFMKMAETFFATRFAMLRDRFGISWMLLQGVRQS